MTDLQEDLTGAFERRARAAIAEDNLDAILAGTNVVRFSSHDESARRGGALLAVAASAAVLVGAVGLVWATSARTNPPASSTAPAGPVDTIPTEFPSEVPRPDTFALMTIMTSDGAPVGWEFSDRGEPADSVERCTRYASSFDQDWTSTEITDEAPAVLYARSFGNTRWDVGIYCIDDGGYLVQVMPAGSTDPNATVATVSSRSNSSEIPADTAPGAVSDSTDDLRPIPPATIPAAFPDDVPRPDTFDAMSIMWWDDSPVGWEFNDQSDPTDSVERCTQYAASFGSGWISTAITDEAESVIYARSFTNAAWDVGIYCIEDGGYLVQVMPTAS